MSWDYKHIDHDGIMRFRIWKNFQTASYIMKVSAIWHLMSNSDIRTMLKIMEDIDHGKPSDYIFEIIQYGKDIKSNHPKEQKHFESVRKALKDYYFKYKEKGR